MPPKILGDSPPNLGRKKHQILTTFFREFITGHRISPEQNVALTNKNASVNLQCVPYKVTYFPWPLTQKRLRSVCSLWPTLQRPLRCNHLSCDMSSFIWNAAIRRNRPWIKTFHIDKFKAASIIHLVACKASVLPAVSKCTDILLIN